jgi:hypothetical protein
MYTKPGTSAEGQIERGVRMDVGWAHFALPARTRNTLSLLMEQGLARADADARTSLPGRLDLQGFLLPIVQEAHSHSGSRL